MWNTWTDDGKIFDLTESRKPLHSTSHILLCVISMCLHCQIQLSVYLHNFLCMSGTEAQIRGVHAVPFEVWKDVGWRHQMCVDEFSVRNANLANVDTDTPAVSVDTCWDWLSFFLHLAHIFRQSGWSVVTPTPPINKINQLESSSTSVNWAELFSTLWPVQLIK